VLCRGGVSGRGSFSGSGGPNSNPAGTGSSGGAIGGGEGRRDGVTHPLSSMRLIPLGEVAGELVENKVESTALAPRPAGGSGAIKPQVNLFSDRSS